MAEEFPGTIPMSNSETLHRTPTIRRSAELKDTKFVIYYLNQEKEEDDIQLIMKWLMSHGSPEIKLKSIESEPELLGYAKIRNYNYPCLVTEYPNGDFVGGVKQVFAWLEEEPPLETKPLPQIVETTIPDVQVPIGSSHEAKISTSGVSEQSSSGAALLGIYETVSSAFWNSWSSSSSASAGPLASPKPLPTSTYVEYELKTTNKWGRTYNRIYRFYDLVFYRIDPHTKETREVLEYKQVRKIKIQGDLNLIFEIATGDPINVEGTSLQIRDLISLLNKKNLPIERT